MRAIRGRVAAVKWSYFTAATVEGYAVTRDPTGAWTVSASLVPGAMDAYKLAQRPLYFVAPFKRGAWRWEIRTMTVQGGHLSAQLGTLITEDHHGLTRPQTRH